MDPTNIALGLVLIAMIVLIPCGCIMTRPGNKDKAFVPAEAASSALEWPVTSNNEGAKGSEYSFRREKDEVAEAEEVVEIISGPLRFVVEVISGPLRFTENWKPYLIEGIILVLLGVLAIVVPPFVESFAALFLFGCLFLISGIAGLIATFAMRQAPGFWWSLASAVIGILAGLLLLAQPIPEMLTPDFVLIAFFILEGVATIMFALEHKKSATRRWEWMLVSGAVDIFLAAAIVFDLLGPTWWATGLIIGFSLVFSGVALIAMAVAQGGLKSRAWIRLLGVGIVWAGLFALLVEMFGLANLRYRLGDAFWFAVALYSVPSLLSIWAGIAIVSRRPSRRRAVMIVLTLALLLRVCGIINWLAVAGDRLEDILAWGPPAVLQFILLSVALAYLVATRRGPEFQPRRTVTPIQTGPPEMHQIVPAKIADGPDWHAALLASLHEASPQEPPRLRAWLWLLPPTAYFAFKGVNYLTDQIVGAFDPEWRILVWLVLTTFVLLPAFWLPLATIWRWNLRARQRRAEEVLKKSGAKRPIFYLRSFALDDEIGQPSIIEWAWQYANTEQKITRTLGQCGPVIAIGRPGEGVPALGAARFYVANVHWQEKVADVATVARLVVWASGTTQGLEWEITHLIRSLSPEKLVLWAHPHLLDLDADEREVEWSGFVDGLGSLFPKPLPKPLGATRFFAFDKDFTPIPFGSRGWPFQGALTGSLRALLRAKGVPPYDKASVARSDRIRRTILTVLGLGVGFLAWHYFGPGAPPPLAWNLLASNLIDDDVFAPDADETLRRLRHTAHDVNWFRVSWQDVPPGRLPALKRAAEHYLAAFQAAHIDAAIEGAFYARRSYLAFDAQSASDAQALSQKLTPVRSALAVADHDWADVKAETTGWFFADNIRAVITAREQMLDAEAALLNLLVAKPTAWTQSVDSAGSAALRFNDESVLSQAQALAAQRVAATAALASALHAQSDPSNFGWQRDLSVSYDRVGDVLKDQGDLAGALKSYRDSLAIREQLAKSDPSNAGWQRDLSVSYDNIGNVQNAQGDLDHAIADYTQAIQLDPSTGGSSVIGGGYLDRGNAYYAKGDYDRAIADYTQAIQLDPSKGSSVIGGYLNRGNAYKAKSDLDQAIADYSEAIQLNPKYARAYDNRGDAYYAKGDYDRAIADFSDAIQLDPKYALAYDNRGDAYYAKKDYDAAIADYTRAIQIDPKFTYAYANRGDAYEAKKDYEHAIASYTEAIRLTPGKADYRNDRGNAYQAKKDYEHAIADFSDAIRLDPKYALAYDNRGDAYKAKGDLDRAIADYSEAIRLTPGKADYRNDRGNAYEAKKDYEHAIADFSDAIQLDPKYALAYDNRGDAYVTEGNYDRAITDYTEAIQLNPKSDWTYFNRGRADLYSGALPRALADLNQASQLNPKNAYVALWLDIANRRSNLPSRLPEAMKQIEMTRWPAPIVSLYLGQLTPEAALAAADDPDANTKKGQVCEVNFYSGEMALQDSNKNEATRLFRLSAADCPKTFVEYDSAKAELKALGATP
jgi:tetratricopeptide (TPR) repeat protein/uncharacterized membrane protein HdeD (DUF308 family)